MTLARSISATGRNVSFYHGAETLPEMVKPDDRHTWIRGLVVVGPFDQLPFRTDTPVGTLASAGNMVAIDTTLAAVRAVGVPVLLLAMRLPSGRRASSGKSSLAALRDTPIASSASNAAAWPNRSCEF